MNAIPRIARALARSQRGPAERTAIDRSRSHHLLAGPRPEELPLPFCLRVVVPITALG